MSTSDTPPGAEGTSVPKGTDAGGVMLMFALLYPLLVGTVLWVLGFFALMGLLYYETGGAALFVLAAVVLIGGAHLLLQVMLEKRGEPRAWQFPTALTTAMTAALTVDLVPLFLYIDTDVPLPLLCLLFCMLGTGVFTLHRGRFRLTSTLAVVIVVALLVIGRSWWADGQGAQAGEELRSDDATSHLLAEADPSLDLGEPVPAASDGNHGRRD